MEVRLGPKSVVSILRGEALVTTHARDLESEKLAILSRLKEMGYEVVDPHLAYWKEQGLSAKIRFSLIHQT
jgi:hypothetical protein